MFTRLHQIFGAKQRLLLSSLFCLLLAAGLAACQPKQTSPQDNVAQGGTQTSAQTTTAQSPLDDAEYATAVMKQNPEFTESELTKIYKDMEPVSRGSMAEVVNYLDKEKGWPQARSYYILTKVASAEMILQDGEAGRQMVADNWPEEIPTAQELALVEKHRATLHKLIGMTE